MTVEQLYEQEIRPLPAGEPMRLATMILNGIPPRSVVDFSTEWSDDDLQASQLLLPRRLKINAMRAAGDLQRMAPGTDRIIRPASS